MSEPTKNMPDDAILARWAKGDINVLGVQSLAAEVLRLRAELAKASAERDAAVDESRRQDTDLSTELSMANAEVNRLRAEVQRLESERGQFGPCSDGWTYSIGSIAWGKTIESPSRVSLSRKHVDGRREELFDFVPQQGSSPVVRMGGIVAKAGDEIVGSVEFRGDYDPEQDAPPADVLGEALRRSVFLATPGKGLPLGSRDGCLLGESVDAAKFRHLHAAVSELAQVVERIARQQGGGK